MMISESRCIDVFITALLVKMILVVYSPYLSVIPGFKLPTKAPTIHSDTDYERKQKIEKNQTSAPKHPLRDCSSYFNPEDGYLCNCR